MYLLPLLRAVRFSTRHIFSVAAAATAASLLTGSSEPILSSGLAPPGSSPLPNSTSSTPSLLGHSGSAGHPFGPVPNAPLADISAAGQAERMRQAWGTIRERLGLRPSMPPPPLEQDNPDNTNAPNISPGTEPTTHAPASLPDTKELMLAEMARAFNVGLGLNGLSGGLGHGGGAPHHAEGDRQF
ncbi:hypothetical protein B0H34DRAFT_266272 [Crassisporium funariophilum]|nr:hypothetical protein B0H34DRAFT_266272 [Crassisporium funariophilum]